MMNFENHEIMLDHVNTRMEKHGDVEVLTFDLKIKFDLPNKSLDRLSPRLRGSLYDADDTQDMIDGDNTPHLRHPQLGILRWAGKWSPVLFVFHDGESEGDDLSFHDAKLDRIAVDPKDGGTCSYTVRIQVHPETSDVGARILDLIHAPDTRGTLEVSDEALAGSDDDDDDD